MSKSARLKMYLAYVDYHHLTWHGIKAYDRRECDGATDRLAFPVVATSKRHAIALADKAWGRKDRKIQVVYVGPCQEPGS
jgi:hypothetical protein